MLYNLFAMFAISLKNLEDIDWTKVIIISAVVSFLIACVISFFKMKKKYIDDTDNKNKK